MNFLDLSAVTGLLAAVALTINLLLGMMLSTGYKRHAYWKLLPRFIREWNIDRIHNWTAYLVLALVLAHPLLLLGDESNEFRLQHIFVPFSAPKQPVFVSLGVLAFYALLLVIITSQKKIKRQLGFRYWKNIHLVSYCTALLFLVHGIAMDPLLKDRPVDFIDGEKLLVELCGVVLFTATIIRTRYHLRLRSRK